MTGMTRVTGMTRMTGVTEMTRVKGMTWMATDNGVTGITRVMD